MFYGVYLVCIGSVGGALGLDLRRSCWITTLEFQNLSRVTVLACLEWYQNWKVLMCSLT
jgi:hypothetical protein